MLLVPSFNPSEATETRVHPYLAGDTRDFQRRHSLFVAILLWFVARFGQLVRRTDERDLMA